MRDAYGEQQNYPGYSLMLYISIKVMGDLGGWERDAVYSLILAPFPLLPCLSYPVLQMLFLAMALRCQRK